uniref:Genome polyprotein n=2 Tax=Lily mottle virus TaxID=32624 RepID=Q4GXV0_9POTV|nr:polyprotein [Lily mottle virus]
MASFTVGSILVNTASVLKESFAQKVLTTPPVLVAQPVQRSFGAARMCAREAIADDEEKVAKAFSALEARCAARVSRMGTIRVKVTRSGTLRAQPLPKREQARLRKAERKARLDREEFLKGSPTVIDHISIAGGAQPSQDMVEPMSTRKAPWHSESKKARKAIPRSPTLNETGLASLMRAIAKIGAKNSIRIEIVDERKVQARYIKRDAGSYLQVRVAHHEGLRRRRDLKLSAFADQCLTQLASTTHGTKYHHVTQLKAGDSGIVLLARRLFGWHSGSCSQIFVVRGNHEGKLYEARRKVTLTMTHKMIHYSRPGDKFWAGFNSQFLRIKPKEIPHTCTSNFNVFECGQVAALMCQALYPCGRITCQQCASEYLELTKVELGEKLSDGLYRTSSQIRENHREFAHVAHILNVIADLLSLKNNNMEAFTEVHKLIGERTQSPFTHLNRLNSILIKGSDLSSNELYECSDCIRELARFQKNRTDNIKKLDVSVFRNKASSKSYFNLDLMCDNQLDKNGNFEWGQRGYHAKRFLSNYFEVVNTQNAYREHTLRKHPNGTRELAIGKFIVSTNFEVFRKSMEGKRIPQMPVTEACLSQRGERFIYQCCCVTNEDGTPLESTFKMPTKNTLVLGNTGDEKFVDMPTDTDEKMYIAREGYCYINIFFAMLINVRESQAKAFTKMVRDRLVPELGTWPTMIDVATACHTLTVFFPDTLSAELPRILVDHNTKTMHVIDSYGSVSTGYHQLKANTVSQLVLFASDTLKSEMKHYQVGGRKFTVEYEAVKLLIKAIYRPKLMRTLMEDEPYLICLAMCSPGVLIALFNSGSLETAINYWIARHKDTAQIFALLTVLATKVSVARTLTEQLAILSDHATDVLKIMDRTFATQHSVSLVHTFLMQLEEKRHTDVSLVGSGFANLSATTHELMEKNYLAELDASWQDLSLLEKCSQMRWSFRSPQQFSNELHPSASTDLNGRYNTSVRALSTRYMNNLRKSVCTKYHNMKIRTHQFIGRQVCNSIMGSSRFFPDLAQCVHILAIFSILLNIIRTINIYTSEYIRLKNCELSQIEEKRWNKLLHTFDMMEKIDGQKPTLIEFTKHLKQWDPELYSEFHSILQDEEEDTEEVQFQAKPDGERNLERIMAIIALTMMVFDADRSDCVYKVLNKLKGLLNTVHQEPVKFQSIDDIQDYLEEREMVIDFEISADDHNINKLAGATFEQWWSNQMECNNVLPHYRTEGFFMEFTRANAAHVANEIAHGPHKDLLIRGAVGSGKSTGLPFYLSKRGRVLMLEPTRPLASNVHKQLAGDPFLVSATLKMRGETTFGSAPITVMTSGYAFHYYANNPNQLRDFEFIIFDECHVNDSSAMAFRSLLAEYTYDGRIIKVSATPPGREVEFATQHPVEIIPIERLTFQQFVAVQGTGAVGDVTTKGDNILVYVASYSEVDNLSKGLVEKGHKVTKVDGRTMKVGGVEIITSGSQAKKHFVVATNIIENGVTLDIDVVVDFGLKVVAEVDIDSRLTRYVKKSISYGERIQRLGRVGRNKPGAAVRVGTTEKGLQAIPVTTATEAAFLCFAYGLPVMTNNVSTNILTNCTVLQARTMMLFEINPFYMCHFVRFDGTMHPEVHRILTPYKLRDSEIILNKVAIPNKGLMQWPTAKEYAYQGFKMNIPDTVRLPFHSLDIPERLHERMWQIVETHKGDAGFGRITTASACKIAYTLKTDAASIQRTIHILDKLIENELKKQEYFRNITSASCSSSSFSLTTITNAIRARHIKDHTVENVSVLQAAKAQILEFKNVTFDLDHVNRMTEYGALECVQFQTLESMTHHLQLKGHWNKSLLTHDVVICGAVLIGCVLMVGSYFKERCSGVVKRYNENVKFQAKNKRQRQRLRFREARDNKHAYEVHGDDADIQTYFGSAYTKKGKTKGVTRGMGIKTRKFVNMYNFDPTEYSFARYVDPLTGYTLDEQTLTDIALVQDHFGRIRRKLMEDGELEKESLAQNARLEVYFVKNLASQILKIDMTPHNPLRVCDRIETVAGFPERDMGLRQSGKSVMVTAAELPKENPYPGGEIVEFENKSTFHGLRDYNPIATCVCRLEHNSDGHTSSLYGIGYGSYIITNQHLFIRNNGTINIESHHGTYHIRNSTQLQLYPIEGRDIVIIQLPKDFPPFARRLKFRHPTTTDKVCLVGTNFQEKTTTSTVSEASLITRKDDSHFFRHWISTKDGQCGLPAVSTKDGCVLGLHSLTSLVNDSNFFIAFPDDFEKNYLERANELNWVKHWKLNVDKICWGALSLEKDKPSNMFKLSKDIQRLDMEPVGLQSREDKWLFDRLNGNLKAMARTRNQLVTKHVVKGKCLLFETYLNVTPKAKEYFTPMMGAYQKSRLNKEAYIKDLFKYSSPIVVGDVDCAAFEAACDSVTQLFEGAGFGRCNYVTDEQEIFSALNMNAAVGAMYSGKKRDYFKDFTDLDKESILRDSCLRLYQGKMGVWNGSLKAELRAKEKVDLNKTRTFTAAPVDTLLGEKTCVDDFNNRFYSLNIACPWSVGMTKFYKGWDEMLRKLPEGWVYCDADGSQFDSSLSPYLINAVLNLRLHFMEEWDVGAQMLQNLYTEIIYTPIATPDGTIIKKFKGNNSGQPSTVVDNTIMVILAIHYSYKYLKITKPLDEFCKYFVNGDDILLAVAPEFEYLLDHFANTFQQLGLNYDFSSRTKNREELWFMSHRGIMTDGLYIPKLEPERIVSILEWDRAVEPVHRPEAICASMIEAWGYPQLLHEIRKFYYWVLEQAPYSELAQLGKAPYLSEAALRALFTGEATSQDELERYLAALDLEGECGGAEIVAFQANETLNAGASSSTQTSRPARPETAAVDVAPQQSPEPRVRDRDVDAGTVGTFQIPRLKALATKISIPKIRGRTIVNLGHLANYNPEQTDISNTRSTQKQFETWYNAVKDEYGLNDESMALTMNGLMVWCIENGTSPNINGAWLMMDGDQQVEFPLRPIIEHAKPTLRQIMAHFSHLAEAYIEKQNAEKPYMPRYGLQRNLTDFTLARFAFDFYEVTSRTPARAKEAHFQMKTAALRGKQSKLFGLDGKVTTQDEDTERHTADDVNKNMHPLLGISM